MRDTPDTHHLDTAIKIFGGGRGGGKRSVKVTLHYNRTRDEYIIQIGSRVMGEGNTDFMNAVALAEAHRVSLALRLQRTIQMEVFA